MSYLSVLLIVVVLFVLVIGAIVVLVRLAMSEKKLKHRIDVKNEKSEEESEDIESKIDI